MKLSSNWINNESINFSNLFEKHDEEVPADICDTVSEEKCFVLSRPSGDDGQCYLQISADNKIHDDLYDHMKRYSDNTMSFYLNDHIKSYLQIASDKPHMNDQLSVNKCSENIGNKDTRDINSGSSLVSEYIDDKSKRTDDNRGCPKSFISVTVVSEALAVEVFVGEHDEYYGYYSTLPTMKSLPDSRICSHTIKFSKAQTIVKLCFKQLLDISSLFIYGVHVQVAKATSLNIKQPSNTFSSDYLNEVLAERNITLSDKGMVFKNMLQHYNDSGHFDRDKTGMNFSSILSMVTCIGKLDNLTREPSYCTSNINSNNMNGNTIDHNGTVSNNKCYENMKTNSNKILETSDSSITLNSTNLQPSEILVNSCSNDKIEQLKHMNDGSDSKENIVDSTSDSDIGPNKSTLVSLDSTSNLDIAPNKSTLVSHTRSQPLSTTCNYLFQSDLEKKRTNHSCCDRESEQSKPTASEIVSKYFEENKNSDEQGTIGQPNKNKQILSSIFESLKADISLKSYNTKVFDDDGTTELSKTEVKQMFSEIIDEKLAVFEDKIERMVEHKLTDYNDSVMKKLNSIESKLNAIMQD